MSLMKTIQEIKDFNDNNKRIFTDLNELEKLISILNKNPESQEKVVKLQKNYRIHNLVGFIYSNNIIKPYESERGHRYFFSLYLPKELNHKTFITNPQVTFTEAMIEQMNLNYQISRFLSFFSFSDKQKIKTVQLTQEDILNKIFLDGVKKYEVKTGNRININNPLNVEEVLNEKNNGWASYSFTKEIHKRVGDGISVKVKTERFLEDKTKTEPLIMKINDGKITYLNNEDFLGKCFIFNVVLSFNNDCLSIRLAANRDGIADVKYTNIKNTNYVFTNNTITTTDVIGYDGNDEIDTYSGDDLECDSLTDIPF